jgi:hypothetical protein
MPDLEFLGTLHRTLRHMHDAIAEEWLAAEAGGCEVLEHPLGPSADKLAADAIAGFGLHELQGFDHGELVEAFSRLRSARQ